MASPFRVFRKYMKTLLVVFGVMLMFVFVIGDAMVSYLGGSRRGGGDATRDPAATAVSWDSGSLTNQELEQLAVRRAILNQFIRSVVYLGSEAAIQAGIEPRRLQVEPIILPETPEQGVERSVVNTRLFAEAARHAGVRVSDATIVQYLYELGRGNVSPDEMRAILSRLQAGGGAVSIDYIIEALREEMLARNFEASHRLAHYTVTPQQRWDDWRSVNDRIAIEAAAIPIERFLVDVKEPTDAELEEFYDKYKNRDPQPDFLARMEFPSPHPGFRIPRKIDVQFLEAKYEDFVTKAEEEVTDAEIEKYYEEKKDPMFIKAGTDLFDMPIEGEDAQGDAPADDAAEITDSAPVDEAATNETSPKATESSSNEPADEPPPTGEPADSSPDQPEDAPATDNAAPQEEDQSSLPGRGRQPTFRLAAFLQEESDATAPADSSAQETPSDTESSQQPADTTEDPSTATQPAESAAETPPADSAEANAESPAPPPADASLTSQPPASSPEPPAQPKEFQPLDEVRDLIRRQIAEDKVAEQLDQAVNEVANQLNAEFNQYFGRLLDAPPDAPPPAPPEALADLAPLAEKHGFEHGSTGPLSLLEMRDTPVGKSINRESNLPLLNTLFGGREIEPYQPITTVDVVEGNRFIAMKTADTPGRVPELSEIKDQVVEAWKRQQAAELALKYAEAEAKKAQESNSNLADYFADDDVEVVRTDQFSRFTGGEVGLSPSGQLQQQPYRYSQPDGITAAGPEFLREVFEIDDDEVVALLNHDHSIAYVVRIVEHQYSPDELRSTYLAEADTWPGLQPMVQGHAQNAAAQLFNAVSQGAGLEWKRPADHQQQDEEESS